MSPLTLSTLVPVPSYTTERKRFRAAKEFKIELDPDEVQIILRHGYPEEQLAGQLRPVAKGDQISVVKINKFCLEMLIGQLSRTYNHDEAGDDEEEVLDLCERLEYVERTGDGTLETLD